MKITPSMVQTYSTQYKQKYPGDPEGYGLKKHLKHEIEQKLTNDVPSLGFENVSQIKVADIQFSFKNASLINALVARGTNIKNNDWTSYKKTNEKLDQIKTKEYQNLLNPVGAFITFEGEEGLQRCLVLSEKQRRITILGEKP